MSEVEYFRCNCASPDHAFTVEYIDDEGPLGEDAYMYVILDRPRGFFNRLARAFRYMLGDDGRCIAAEVILDKKDQQRLADVLSKKAK